MKPAVLSLLVATLLGCSASEGLLEPEPDPSEPVATADVGASGDAGSPVLSDWTIVEMPYPSPVIHPCTGEPVALTGTLIIKNRVEVLENGFRSLLIADTRNVRGRGLISGKVYYNDNEEYHEIVTQGLAYEETWVTSALFTRGVAELTVPNDDWFSWIVLHIRINSSGVTTAEVVRITEGCK